MKMRKFKKIKKFSFFPKNRFVSIHNLYENLCHQFGVVLMHSMANFVQHFHLELPAHLACQQLFVQSVDAGQYQHFDRFALKEEFR